MIARANITGLVLAGGRGSRMGGADKGLRNFRGRPLAQHAAERLAPQVGRVLISANRNLEAYASFGLPVCADADDGYNGPLAGFAAGLERCETPWLAAVPCDAPLFPTDLVERLANALDDDARADIAIACTREEDGTLRAHPVFCLMRCALRESLARFMQDGGRRVERWTAQHARVDVAFDDARAFGNANTPAELEALQESAQPQAHG